MRIMRALLPPVTAVAAVGLSFVLATPAWAAGPPTASGGSGTITPVSISSRSADGNTFLDISFVGTMTGTFTGTFTETATEVIHPDGTATAHGFGTFTGQAGSCGTGSFGFQVGVHGTVALLTGRFGSIDQSGATVTIHTENTFVTPAPGGGPGTFVYSGQYHC
jgi:hypothetical protein